MGDMEKERERERERERVEEKEKKNEKERVGRATSPVCLPFSVRCACTNTTTQAPPSQCFLPREVILSHIRAAQCHHQLASSPRGTFCVCECQ